MNCEIVKLFCNQKRLCSNIFESIIYDNMFKVCLDNNLISPEQSGFRPGDSCINQLLSITSYIITSFDNELEK